MPLGFLPRGSGEGQAAPWDMDKATGNLLCVGFQPTRGQMVTHEPPAAAEMAKHGAPACAEPAGLLLLTEPQFPEMLEIPQGRCKAVVAPMPARVYLLGHAPSHQGSGESLTM